MVSVPKEFCLLRMKKFKSEKIDFEETNSEKTESSSNTDLESETELNDRKRAQKMKISYFWTD